MEWLIIIAIILFAISKLGRGQTPRPTQPVLAASRGPTVGDPDFASALTAWRARVAGGFDQGRWIPASMAENLTAMHPMPIWKGSSWANPVGKSSAADLIKLEIKKHNECFQARQRLARKQFFDTVEKNPLTREQVDACICMDDNVMVVAAAGSGKTSTMVAKAGYVLIEGLAEADQILMLAFNSAAAKELGDRVARRLKGVPGVERISSQTFHAFGLTVIGAATGQKPRLAPWVERNEEGQVMTDIAKLLIATDRRFAHDWDMLRTVYAQEMRTGRLGSEPDGYKNGRRGLATASGDVVKSDEERRIADWLFFMGVEFEYEREYEHATADEQHSSYHPDFYYPDHALYHEHFAIDPDGRSPFGDQYVRGVDWKRTLHQQHGTELFETASHEMRASRGDDGRFGELALLRLEDELIKRGQVLEFDVSRQPKGFFQPTSEPAVVKLIQTFQKHVKNNGLTVADLHARIDAIRGDKSRLDLFVSIYERIAAVWDQKLREGNYLDFEDMLIQAAEHIERGRYTSPFKVVLADEFQDSSRARVRMLKALTGRPGHRAHLCVVGDDWQGINRFAGSDIAVMTEFERQFANATRLLLGTTFRCPARICDVSSRFVQRNPAQIRKQVRTTNTAGGAPIRIFGFKEMEASSNHIEAELASIHAATIAQERKIKVLFLGRYRSDEPYVLQRWQRRFDDRLDVSYRTIHASKGLEAEHVFLLNAVGGARGFPSQIEDDPALQIAMPAPDDYPFAEERRLFYVALTRASRDIRIYTSLTKPSSFVSELQTQEKITVEAVDGEASVPCPKCHQGVLTLRKSRYGPFLGCNTFPKCDHKQPLETTTSKSTSDLGTPSAGDRLAPRGRNRPRPNPH
jgi:DNA helicase-4